MNRCVFLLITAALFFIEAAHAQSSARTNRLTIQGPADQPGSIPKDALGRPCLDLEAAARGQVVNPDMLDHVVSVKNNCARLIKVKVCYFGSEQCRQFDVQGYKRVDTILGTMRGVKFFRYSINAK